MTNQPPPPLRSITVYPSSKAKDPRMKLWGNDRESTRFLRGLGWLNGVPISQLAKLLDQCAMEGLAIVIRTDFEMMPTETLSTHLDETV